MFVYPFYSKLFLIIVFPIYQQREWVESGSPVHRENLQSLAPFTPSVGHALPMDYMSQHQSQAPYYTFSRMGSMYESPALQEETPVQHNHTYAAVPSSVPSTTSSHDLPFTLTSLTQQALRRSNSRRQATISETDCSESVVSDDGSGESQFSRDERRARALNIPIPTADIINLPIDEFNERMSKFELSEAQLSLIRDIRRRGKNKVAAQNCRKRKMDQIMGLQGDVDRLFAQKEAMEQQQAQLLYLRELARDKYAKLYNFFRDSHTDSMTQVANQDPPEDPNDPSRNVVVTTSSEDSDGRRHLPHTLTELNSTSTSHHHSFHHRRHGNSPTAAAGGPSNARALQELEGME
jgi:hypothetical protein